MRVLCTRNTGIPSAFISQVKTTSYTRLAAAPTPCSLKKGFSLRIIIGVDNKVTDVYTGAESRSIYNYDHVKKYSHWSPNPSYRYEVYIGE
jgi:hypothetical protein